MGKAKLETDTEAGDGGDSGNAAKPVESVEMESLLLTVAHEHVATPHGVELRRNGGDVVADVRTQDFASTQTIGAKTVETILREAGAELPVNDEKLSISFSPTTGEVIAV